MGDEYMGPVQGPDNKKKSDSGWFNGLNDSEYKRRLDPSHRREFGKQQYPYQVDYKARSINRSINRYGMDYRGGGGTSISVNLGERIRTGQSTSKGFQHPWKLSNVGNLRVDSPSSPAEKEAEEFASKYSSPAESVEDYKAKWSAMSSENFGTTSAGKHTTSTSDSSILIQASGATEGTTLNTKQQTKVETALQEGGEPLPEDQKNTFEQKLGRTLGEVRIHTGTAAEEAADSINARAFTAGKDIVFGAGEYRPGMKEGNHLLAHEMAHVAQNQGGISRKIQRKAKGTSLTVSSGEKDHQSLLEKFAEKGKAVAGKIKDYFQRQDYVFEAAHLGDIKYNEKFLRNRMEKDARELIEGLGVSLVAAGAILAIPAAVAALVGLALGAEAAPAIALGVLIGTTVLEFAGLVAIATYIEQTGKEMGLHYRNFLKIAWDSGGDNKKIDAAAREFATGNAVLFSSILEAVLFVASLKGFSKSYRLFKETRFVRWIGEAKFFRWMKGRLSPFKKGKKGVDVEGKKGENGTKSEVVGNTPFASKIPGKVIDEFSLLKPSSLREGLQGSFSGGRHALIQLEDDLILHRVWHPGSAREFGAFWSTEKPQGSLQIIMDSALVPEWGNQATRFTSIRVPSGTQIYVGEISSQGGHWIGGQSQILINSPIDEAWKIGGGYVR